jgi:hypothetical protein
LSIFTAVWDAMGFIPGPPNYDGEWYLNCTAIMNILCNVQTLQGLSCSANHSDNLVDFAAVSPQGGHDDPNSIWNQDMFEFMLLGDWCCDSVVSAQSKLLVWRAK